MDEAKLRDVLTTALPAEKIMARAHELGVVKRESVIELDELVSALVLVSRTPAGGRQADVMRSYNKAVEVEPVRGAFYARFNTGLESLLESLLRDNIAAVQRDQVLLPEAISGVVDWIDIDSETVTLHPSLKATYLGTGNYAAVKVHKAYSIGWHNMVDFELSPAREHDSKRFKVVESMRGQGLLMDLAYASHARLSDCRRHGVAFVVKLKSGWEAAVEEVHEGLMSLLLAGTDIADAVAFGQLTCEKGIIDADVRVGSGSRAYPLRLVALELPDNGLCVFLTDLPRERYPARIVGDLYRLRWEIEKSNKLDKSDHCLEDLDCRKVCSARTMIYASLLGSSIVGRLVHADHQAMAASSGPMKRGPIHARLLALALASLHAPISAARQRHDDNDPQWAVLARKLAHQSRDPNWRRRPSVLDVLFGFTAAPGRPRRQKTIESATKKDGGGTN